MYVPEYGLCLVEHSSGWVLLPMPPIQPVDATVVRGSGSSCGVAKDRVDNQSENQYCLDWFMCFRKESK